MVTETHPLDNDSLQEELMLEAKMKRWKYIFIALNTIILVVALSLISLLMQLEHYWDFFYPFLTAFPEIHGVGIMFASCSVCICATLGYVITCTRKSSHFIWYGLSLIMVIILDLKVIITGVVNDEMAHKLVNKTLTQGMRYYSTNTTYTHYVDRMQLSLLCCGVENYKDWYDMPIKNVPFSCCPFSYPITNMSSFCEYESIVNHLFKESCLDQLLKVPDIGLILVYCIVTILISLKILSLMLTYKLEKGCQYL